MNDILYDSVYDYTLECRALEDQISGQEILVHKWHGTEGVSQLYRYDVTVALQVASDLNLQDLLNQPATLNLRCPDKSLLKRHGIITQVAQAGHDETHDYYTLTIEPRLIRLALHTWSDIYLQYDLHQLISELLTHADLSMPFQGETQPWDYDIRVADDELTKMARPFVCQFEESCLNFLQRKLEFYGIYFWFEHGSTQEGIVFANAIEQQPTEAIQAIHYPKGALNPDNSEIAIQQLNRRVCLHPNVVSLRALHNEDNTRLDLHAETELDESSASLGTVESASDHFTVVDQNSSSSENGIAGQTLAKWRAQERTWQAQQIQGKASTPGLTSGYFVDISENRSQNNLETYYILSIDHAGTQPMETSSLSVSPAYEANFTALPRWIDSQTKNEPIQFRPLRTTPSPNIARLMSGFVDGDRDEPKRFAQPDDQGRYKVRLPFIRKNHGDYRNSAWLRMSTPYAGSPTQADEQPSGMHFPLREGTEVLIAFLNGDPDLPVIVGSLPNTQAPSTVNQDNARQHIMRTPGGSGLTITDGDAANASMEISTTTDKATFLLGEKATTFGDGFSLKTNSNAEIVSNQYMLIEVPGSLRITSVTKGKDLPGGVSTQDSGGIVVENFTGAKFTTAESSTWGMTRGKSTSVFADQSMTGTFGSSTTIKYATNKIIDLESAKRIWNSDENVGRSRKEKFMSLSSIAETASTTALTYAVDALESYTVTAPLGGTLQSLTNSVQFNPTGLTLNAPVGSVNTNALSITNEAAATILLKSLGSEFYLSSVNVDMHSGGIMNLTATGAASIRSNVIRIG